MLISNILFKGGNSIVDNKCELFVVVAVDDTCGLFHELEKVNFLGRGFVGGKELILTCSTGDISAAQIGGLQAQALSDI